MASGLLPFAMSEFFSGVQEANLLRIKNTFLANSDLASYCYVLLDITLIHRATIPLFVDYN